MYPHDFVSKSCGGERCSVCGDAATKKIEEVLFEDDPWAFREIGMGGSSNKVQARHPLTNYLCSDCFCLVMTPKFWKERHSHEELVIIRKITK